MEVSLSAHPPAVPPAVLARLDQLEAAISDRGWVVLHTHPRPGGRYPAGGLIWHTAGLTSAGMPEVYLFDPAPAPCPGGAFTSVADGWAWDVLDQVAASCARGGLALAGRVAVRCGGRDELGRPLDDPAGPLIVQLVAGWPDVLSLARLLYPGRVRACEVWPYPDN